jgi:hypothetical protein
MTTISAQANSEQWFVINDARLFACRPPGLPGVPGAHDARADGGPPASGHEQRRKPDEAPPKRENSRRISRGGHAVGDAAAFAPP